MGILNNLKGLVGADEDGFTLGDKLKRLDRGTIGRRARAEEEIVLKNKLKMANEQQKAQIELLTKERDRYMKILDVNDPDLENSTDYLNHVRKIEATMAMGGIPHIPYEPPQRTFRSKEGLTVEQAEAINRRSDEAIDTSVDDEFKGLFATDAYEGREKQRLTDIQDFISDQEAVKRRGQNIRTITTERGIEVHTEDSLRAGGEPIRILPAKISNSARTQTEIEMREADERGKALDTAKAAIIELESTRQGIEAIAQSGNATPEDMAVLQEHLAELEEQASIAEEVAAGMYRKFDQKFRENRRPKKLNMDSVKLLMSSHPIFEHLKDDVVNPILKQVVIEVEAEWNSHPSANVSTLINKKLSAIQAELEQARPGKARYGDKLVDPIISGMRLAFSQDNKEPYKLEIGEDGAVEMYLPFRGEYVRR
jgi:hypothetical protein